LVVACIAISGLVIWKWPGLSVRALRALELLIVGVVIVFMVAGNAYLIQVRAWLQAEDWLLAHWVISDTGTRLDSVSLRGFALVVAYGTIIPNTWHRCAAVVGVIAATFLGSLLVQAAVSGMRPASLVALMLYPAMWMATAVVIAVFGSHRLSVLQQEIAEARKLGQYQLKRRLGSGGMGEVYLAEHVLLKQPVAVKVIRPERAGDRETLRRFEREVKSTARLKHPNTVEIYDYGHTADGTFYYVMEYLPGLTLEELVNQYGPLPPARVVYLLRQLCGALREAHEIGLVHRDIKPANVIVCERGGVPDVAKLLDFGLVKKLKPSRSDETATQVGVLAGTPAYMSPEQVSCKDLIDIRSDIYSLGAVGYFLLSGREVFANRSPVHVLAAHLYETPRPFTESFPEVSTELCAIILRCLAKNPEERYPDAPSVEKALANCRKVGRWTEEDAAGWWRTQVGPDRPG
jgi:serine/threonine-protein kinase